MADRFDLDAIEADDALLDLLAAGGESARVAGEHDAAVQLLAGLRLAVEVEDELPVETIDDPESFLARCAALNPITDPFARKMATRGLALGVAAVAALSVSGVAAAVNGDPLSPYEKVIEKMVDAVRPQTSFPKEDLDGLPVMDKTKIVKVGKDYKQQAQAERAAQAAGKDGSLINDPAAVKDDLRPPVAVLPTEKPLVVLEKPTIPPPTSTKTDDPDDVNVDKPSDTKTDPPTDTTGGDGTDGTTTTTTPPPSTPTDTPTSTPTDPPSTPTDTTTPPPNDTGTGDNTVAGDPTGAPTSTPTGDNGQTTDGTGGTGGTGGSGTQGTGSSDTSGSDTSTPGGDEKPSDEVTQVPGGKDPASIVGDILSPILPTPTGGPITIESAEQFFGDSQVAGKPPTVTKATAKKTASAKKAAGKHSSGTVTTGSVRKAYPKGKHSTGLYPEGKHAAIERTHGSTADADVLAILQIVNAPVNK
ncbi:hypothetical protein [Kribbella sp. NPDC049584]|uniref:hypothetical protein n=1 Tax=Kribbella sp. NPDC049584 TaxID=3154833 RepID=UPI0034480EA9